MSGKPASVGASRAGVPGTPRVVVYVADPRQLEPGAAAPDLPPVAATAAPANFSPPPLDALYIPDNVHHQVNLPRNTVYRTQLDRSNQRNLPGTLFYKQLNDNDAKVGVYSTPDSINQRPEYYPVSQQFMKEACIKNEDGRSDQPGNLSVKRDCSEQVGIEFNSAETFNGRIPVETLDLPTYQARCSGTLGSENTMSVIHPTTLRHGQSQCSENITVQSGGEGVNCSERELSVCKSFVNYQFLEQSVSHQSIVNQSISILNQQVGVNRGIVSEGESGTPQLVQTADGVVLAVLPTPVLPHPSDTPELSSRTVVQSDSPQTITVPLGWKRIVNGTSVLYVSPSGTALSTLPQLRDYLQTAGTCKCGLPCPLRPETAFSFDSQVLSKPYQAASGAELTKLCNHKRKLLTTLQARSQSPATPPPLNIDQKKVTGTEVAVLKKGKMKKRAGFPVNVNVSQLMVQRDRPFNEFKESENNRESSLAITPQRANTVQQPCLPGYASVQQQNAMNSMSQDNEIKQEMHVQRSSHYLTVNSGWISQHSQPHLENLDVEQKQNPATTIMNTPLGGGVPILGSNGQVIGVNTHTNKSNNYKQVTAMSQNVLEQEIKEEKKDIIPALQQNMQGSKYPFKEEESQIFCGLNQALTPEVMQKINEQQQIFIQQNQKQIEMAMKGYRSQLAENLNQNKSPGLTQYVPQAQLVIQNGAVVKANPAKTPPWQVKRNESSPSNPLASPSPKHPKTENEYEESNTSISEDSSGSYISFSSNEQINNQGMCSRVPPLPQHYNMIAQQWPAADTNKKKPKGAKGNKKKNSPTENKLLNFGNNGMRPDTKNIGDESPNNNVPSFMDDPSGYLAQQTVLLNNTISKQVGINSSYDTNHYKDNSHSVNCCVTQNQQNHMDRIKSISKPGEMSNSCRNNVSHPSLSPTSTPDSSVLSEKGLDNSMTQCCKGCTISVKSNSPECDNQMRLKYMKHHMYKMELDSHSTTSSPKYGFDDNPVTSSTFMERSLMANDNCGPIQAATVSTSNVSMTETLPPPEPSPTLSNSSRSTDTPHSIGSNNSQMQTNCPYPMSSPVYSNSGSCRDNFSSNPLTPVSNQVYPYNSPGPPSNSHSITGTQVMHFISNHNVNKNLMEVDNISMVGVKPGLKTNQDMFRLEPRRRVENAMPGYCPPPHLGGGPAHTLIQACYVQTFVTTMASGFSVTRDTVTSVLAGKANTATTSINASQANFIRPPPPPSVNLATTYAIPNNQPDPFLNSVNLPTSYPLHIAGTTAQNMISKSPLEMVQNVIGNLPSKSETSNAQSIALAQLNRRTCTTPGQILISSTGQIIVSNNQMPPPPPKTSTSFAPMQGNVTNVTTSVTQVIPAVGGMPPMVNQPTVVVNTLPAPFVIQPPMVAVDGQVMQQNTVLPQLVTGSIVPGQSPNESPRQMDLKNNQGFVQGVAMLSPESLKKRSKKKKSPANITNVLQITAPQQTPSNIMVHHTSPQHNTSPQFSPRGFQLSPNNNISPTPMLQALTIVPGKSGTPAHIVMNGQGNTNNFGSQQIITNTSPSQQINLLQPVNLINNASGVVQNFPAFQQFIVPNLGGMVMTADGTAIIQDNSTGMPVQLQLQTVNGQNVLTPVQNPGMFTAGANGGVVIRAQNQQGKIIQSQHSPGAQFLSPNSQVMMNSPNFNGQLSPLLANLSPTNVAFNANSQVRPGNVQTQEFIQANQMGQALMVPLSPKQVSIAPGSNNRSNSTFVHQNTTIVQQQTTLVSNSHNTQMSSITTNLQGSNASRLSIDPNVLLANNKPPANQKRIFGESPQESGQIEEPRDEKQNGGAFRPQSENEAKADNSDGYMKFMKEFPMLGQGFSHVRHSVSTQTRVNRGKSPSGPGALGAASSPPDTTTHSPLGALEPAASPRPPPRSRAHLADTTTKSPEPADASSSAMVQCVSSSEPDIAESREHGWPVTRNDFSSDNDTQNMLSNTPMMRQHRPHNPVESTDMHYNQNRNTSLNNQQVMPMTSNYFDRKPAYKRKNDFGDTPTYKPDKIMRTPSYNMVHGLPKETDFDTIGMSSPDKAQTRHYLNSGTSSDTSLPKVFDRHLGSGDDTKSSDESDERGAESEGAGGGKFEVGDLVWGPVRGHASWPGELRARAPGGRWAVRWFGPDAAPARLPLLHHSRLLTLSEGLEAHHAARTKHRKSRKLNTLLENAIQEAMAALDKKSESRCVREPRPAVQCDADGDALAPAPLRNKKHDKPRNRDKHHKKNSVKLVPSPNKSSDSTRLRSSR